MLLHIGCAGIASDIEHKIKPMEGPTFDTAAAKQPVSESDTGPDTEIGDIFTSEKPMVRIIKGAPVTNPDAILSETSPAVLKEASGFDTRIESMVLRGVAVRTIAELFTELCNCNVVATSAVANREIDIFLRDLSLREALETVCRLNNLWYRESEGIVTLMTRDEYVQDITVRRSDQTRAFYVRYTNAADMAKVIQAAMGSEVKLEAIEDENIYGHIYPEEKVTIGKSDTSVDELSFAQSLAGAVSASGDAEALNAPNTSPLLAVLTVFKRNNCIVARSLDAELLDEMGRIIAALDTPTSQVLLEIKILQVTLDDNFESFFDFNYIDVGSDNRTVLNAGGSTLLGSNTLSYILNTEQLDAQVSYYEQEGRAQIIATPFLMSANNSTVEFFVGEETPLRDDVTTTTVEVGDQGDTMTVFEVDIVREELGTDVEMTTFINEDNTVTLEFEAEISSPILNYSSVSVVSEQSGEAVEFPLDGISKSELKSILSAKSGQSIAIGGIIKETMDLQESKVPVLGDIPALGFFFREINNTRKKTETVIILTPHVIRHPSLGGDAATPF
jgi:type II secretory pathway component GspD/PulD (secretin)